jgi:hypothetical protein
VPGPPQSLTTRAGDRRVRVSWTPQLTDGGAPITRYRVIASPADASCTAEDATSCTVRGLTNGTPYQFRVRARNAAGWGPSTFWSAPTTPRTVPGAPRNVTGVPANRAVTVTWQAPASDGGSPITRYTARSSPGGLTCTTTGRRTCTVSGLTNGTRYTFRVQARNAAGWGAWSARSAAVVPRR